MNKPSYKFQLALWIAFMISIGVGIVLYFQFLAPPPGPKPVVTPRPPVVVKEKFTVTDIRKIPGVDTAAGIVQFTTEDRTYVVPVFITCTVIKSN